MSSYFGYRLHLIFQVLAAPMNDLNRYVLREAVAGPDQQAYHSIRRSVLFDARGRTGYDETYSEETKPENLRLLLLCDDQPVCAFRLDRAANNVGIIRLRL